MENNNDQLVIVSDAWFNTDFIKKIKSGTKLIINGKYKLTQEDYKNILLYTNIKEVEVYDSVNVNCNGEIKIKISKNVDFRNESYQKLKINKTIGILSRFGKLYETTDMFRPYLCGKKQEYAHQNTHSTRQFTATYNSS